jgi:hypothetical protein
MCRGLFFHALPFLAFLKVIPIKHFFMEAASSRQAIDDIT